MNHIRRTYLVCLLLGALACNASGAARESPAVPASQVSGLAAVPLGERLVGIDVVSAEDGDYDRAMEIARQAGAEVVSLSVYWDEIETVPGVYAPDPNWLEIANQYYPARGVRVALVISVLDTVRARLPADLESKAFDDPEVIARFAEALGYIFSQIPELELVSLAVGNEVDGVLGIDARAWEAYQVFYDSAVERVHALRPGLPVGVKATLEGLTGAPRERIDALNRSSDVVLATYYPLEPDFTVRDPAVVHEDIDALVARHPDRPVFLHETGYPSGAKCGSSEELQAEFVRQVFSAWDAHADRIRLVIFTWLTDVSPRSLRDMESYYGISQPAFLEYLGTLGLRTYPAAGADKAGFAALKDEVRRRAAGEAPAP